MGMKILFTADLHLKLGQKNVPIDWAKNRYKNLIHQLTQLQSQCELFVVGGDIFDKLPNMEELEIYYDLVAFAKVPTIIYPGNHESVKKDTTFFTYLKGVTHRLNPLVTVIDDYYVYEGIVDFIPYNRLKEFEKLGATTKFNYKVLCTHVRGEIPPHVKPEVDLSIFKEWQVVLAGDLHSYENSQLNILYPGSPCTTSFHRNTVDTGVILFDTSDMSHQWIKLELPQLLRKTVSAGEVFLATPYHHTIYEVEGDMLELGELIDSDLIDKKIMKREQDTALILEPEMTLVEELKEYLMYILQLDEKTVEAVVQVFNNHMDKLND
jgi:DNA repair exonuclease SbcCD nuclease subunit